MITIYGKEDCMYCMRAKRLAESNDLDYTYKDITDDRSEFDRLFPGKNKVPQIMWNEKHVGGFEEFMDEVYNRGN